MFTLESGAKGRSVFFHVSPSPRLPRLMHQTRQHDGQVLGRAKGSNKASGTDTQLFLIVADRGPLID